MLWLNHLVGSMQDAGGFDVAREDKPGDCSVPREHCPDCAFQDVAECQSTGYGELVGHLKNCSVTWVPALLICLVERAVKEKVFQESGLMKTIKKVIERN